MEGMAWVVFTSGLKAPVRAPSDFFLFFYFFVLTRSLHLYIFQADEDCYLNYILLIICLHLKHCFWDFSSAPVAKTSHSQCGVGAGLIPGKGTGSHIQELDMAQPKKM